MTKLRAGAVGRNHFIAPLRGEWRNKVIAPYKGRPLRGYLVRGIGSWNSAHPTSGCSEEAFRKSGGAGLFYCFAID